MIIKLMIKKNNEMIRERKIKKKQFNWGEKKSRIKII